jgi:UDP-glucose:(heptosyl)LPS alpha-1,3-glucosyltransferase
MRICLICTDFDKRGGTSRYTVELAERLCKKHEVHLITRKYEYKIPGLIVYEYLPQQGPLVAQIFADAIYAANLLKKIEKNVDLDITHTAASNIVADITTANSCHKAGIKIWNAFSREEYSFPKYLFYKIARELSPANRLLLMQEKDNYQKAKKIISCSEGVKREIITNYNVPEENIVVISNGVDLEVFKPNLQKRHEIRQKYGIDKNEIVLIFVGHEFKRKGLAHLINALPDVNARLIVIGKDNPSKYILLAKDLGVIDKIIFAGSVSNAEDYYAASDIFVFPTMYEAFSLATLEAVASGLPILATKVNGTEELIIDGHNGFFIERDPRKIAEKINILIGDRKLLKNMSKNARKTAKGYSWDSIAERTMKVYKEVALNKRSSNSSK